MAYENLDYTSTPAVDYDRSSVPDEIVERADYVRNKAYGEDVREALAQNAEIAGLIANETSIKQDNLDSEFTDLTKEITGKDIISAPEIIAARGGETTLAKRLDATDAQLAQKVDLKDIAHLTSATPLFADSVVEMTNKTRPYVNMSDGYIYLYNSDAEEFNNTGILYQGTGIQKGSISAEHTDFFRRTKNLLNYKKVLMNKKIESNGKILDATSNESDVIENIKVSENTHYVMNVRGTYAFYDSSGVFIERFSNVRRGLPVLSPANSSYMNVAMVKVDNDYPGLDKIQIEQNTQITPFVPFSELEYMEKELTQKKPYDFSPLPINGSGHRMYNGTAFMQDNLTTFNGHQYAVWWSYEGKPIIAKRRLPYGDWETFDLSTVEGNPLSSPVENDGHNNIVVAVSVDGHIHVVGNHHGHALRYVISDRPEDITSFSKHSLGGSYPGITYPQFFKQKNGGLLLSYRDGGSDSGNTVFYAYNSSDKNWYVRKNPVIDGKITHDHGYLNHIAVDQFGVIHLAGTWRDTAYGNTNRHVFYAKSDDGGLTWNKSDGTILPDPITINNCEIVVETPETDSGILNQSGLEVDYSGNPHIAYFMYDENEHTNIFHLYHNGTNWINEKVTHFTERLETGSGAWSGLLSRPSIFCYENRVFVIYRVSYSDKKGSLRLIEVTPGEEKVDFPIVDIDLNHFEPTFDTQRLYHKNELSILLITNHTNSVDFTNQPAYVYTIDLEQIDDFKNREVEIPTVNLINSLTFRVDTTTPGNFEISGGLPVPQPTLGKKYYGRLNFGGSVGGAGTITSIMQLNGENRGKSKTTGENTFSSTGWVHLESGGVLEPVGNLDYNGEYAHGYYTLEIGEIEYR